MRLDLLEACWQANKDRGHIGQSWDTCLIGGYSKDMVLAIRAIPYVNLAGIVEDTYQLIAGHFEIPLHAAKNIFGRGSLLELREYIDDNTPKLAQMDYKEPRAPKECLTQPIGEAVDHA